MDYRIKTSLDCSKAEMTVCTDLSGQISSNIYFKALVSNQNQEAFLNFMRFVSHLDSVKVTKLFA